MTQPKLVFSQRFTGRIFCVANFSLIRDRPLGGWYGHHYFCHSEFSYISRSCSLFFRLSDHLDPADSRFPGEPYCITPLDYSIYALDHLQGQWVHLHGNSACFHGDVESFDLLLWRWHNICADTTVMFVSVTMTMFVSVTMVMFAINHRGNQVFKRGILWWVYLNRVFWRQSI